MWLVIEKRRPISFESTFLLTSHKTELPPISSPESGSHRICLGLFNEWNEMRQFCSLIKVRKHNLNIVVLRENEIKTFLLHIRFLGLFTMKLWDSSEFYRDMLKLCPNDISRRKKSPLRVYFSHWSCEIKYFRLIPLTDWTKSLL